jgi:hypothetical protein
MYCVTLRNKFDTTIIGWYDGSASNFCTDQRRAKLFFDRADADLVADQLRSMHPRIAQDIEVTPAVVGAGDCPSALHVYLVHHLPGRLRLRSALLKGNARASEETQRHLAEIGGIRSASANPLTGSVLLEYDPEVIPPAKLIDLLAIHGYVPEASAPETEAGTGWAVKLTINALAEHLALAVISALVSSLI